MFLWTTRPCWTWAQRRGRGFLPCVLLPLAEIGRQSETELCLTATPVHRCLLVPFWCMCLQQRKTWFYTLKRVTFFCFLLTECSKMCIGLTHGFSVAWRSSCCFLSNCKIMEVHSAMHIDDCLKKMQLFTLHWHFILFFFYNFLNIFYLKRLSAKQRKPIYTGD